MKEKIDFQILLTLGFIGIGASLLIGNESLIWSGVGTVGTILFIFGWLDLFNKKLFSLLKTFLLLLTVLVVGSLIGQFLIQFLIPLIFALVIRFFNILFKRIFLKKQLNS